MATDNFLWF